MIRNTIRALASGSAGRIALRATLLAVLGLLAPTVLAAPAEAASLGRYCSSTRSDGAWMLYSYSNLTDDPCAHIAAQFPGGTVQRAGLFSASGMNNVVVRCNAPYFNYVGLYQGLGYAPLQNAFQQVLKDNQQGCVFTAAPRDLPIFNSPFAVGWGTYSHKSGFDFARPSYNSLDVVSEFGQPGSTAATIVDWKGRDESGKFIDNYAKHDLNMPQNMPVLAVATGKVLLQRSRLVDHSNPACPGSDNYQSEIYIEHTISGSTGQIVTPGPGAPAPTIYDEKFVTYYGNMLMMKSTAQTNMTVQQGDTIGTAGASGCSSESHLAFGTFRTTNTANSHAYPFLPNTITTGKEESDNGLPVAIDPYGFLAPKGFDPWAWRAFPSGALSINLWNAGQAPDTGAW